MNIGPTFFASATATPPPPPPPAGSYALRLVSALASMQYGSAYSAAHPTVAGMGGAWSLEDRRPVPSEPGDGSMPPTQNPAQNMVLSESNMLVTGPILTFAGIASTVALDSLAAGKYVVEIKIVALSGRAMTQAGFGSLIRAPFTYDAPNAPNSPGPYLEIYGLTPDNFPYHGEFGLFNVDAANAAADFGGPWVVGDVHATVYDKTVTPARASVWKNGVFIYAGQFATVQRVAPATGSFSASNIRPMAYIDNR